MSASSPKPEPRLQGWGTAYFEKLSRNLPPVESADEIHLLNHEEQRKLKWIERKAVLQAMASGAIAAVISGVTYYYADDMYIRETNGWWLANWKYYLITYFVVVVATILEIWLLYRVTLRGVHKLAYVAGVNVFPESEDNRALRASLVQAAMELPAPPSDVPQLKPGREVSRIMTLGAFVLYKAKVSITYFILKVIIRRMAPRVVGQTVLRKIIEFIAIPIYAFWDGLVCFRVLREARIRAMGPTAAQEMCDYIFQHYRERQDAEPDRRTMDAAFRAVACTVSRNSQLHPNTRRLFFELRKYAKLPGAKDIGDSERFLRKFRKLPPPSQQLVLQVLAVAVVLDGRISRTEAKIVQAAFAEFGDPQGMHTVYELRVAFRDGRMTLLDTLRQVGQR